MKFGSDNPMYGRTCEKHPLWKADKAGYHAIHRHVRKYNPPPKTCQDCNLVTDDLELANITGVYDRNIESYRYLCHFCHMKLDGKKHRIDMSERRCHVCTNNKTYTKKNGWSYWYRVDGKLTCGRCYSRYRRYLRGVGNGLFNRLII